MERNLAFAQDTGSCVMFPVVPLMTFLSACSSVGGLALWHKQSRLCTQSSVPGLSRLGPFLILLHNFCVLEQVP